MGAGGAMMWPLVLAAVAPPSPPTTATVPCRQCYRGGCRSWTCPLGQFCAEGTCSASISGPYDAPIFGCNLAPTPLAPTKVECPEGYACCSDSGPFARPVDNLTNYCRDTTTNEFCCGDGYPCRSNQRCCGADSGPKALPRTLEPLGAQGDSSLCVDVTAPPPPPPALGPPDWSGPGACCQDPEYQNLSYVCQTGACCGTDPLGTNDCIDPSTEQCCSGKDDPVISCPKCGSGCPKQQVCGKDLGTCHTSKACNRTLTAVCGWAQRLFPSPERCYECIGMNSERFSSCYNGTIIGKGEDDFMKFCEDQVPPSESNNKA